MHPIINYRSMLVAMYVAGTISIEVFNLALEAGLEEEVYANYPTKGKREKCTLERTSNHTCPPEFYQAWMEYMPKELS